MKGLSLIGCLSQDTQPFVYKFRQSYRGTGTGGSNDSGNLPGVKHGIATSRQILSVKCPKFDFGWGSAPDPANGPYSAPPDP